MVILSRSPGLKRHWAMGEKASWQPGGGGCVCHKLAWEPKLLTAWAVSLGQGTSTEL